MNSDDWLARIILTTLVLCFAFLFWYPLFVYSVRYWHG